MQDDKEKENGSKLQDQGSPSGRNHVDSAILLSDLLIKLKKENDLETNKSGSKLEKRDIVVDKRWMKEGAKENGKKQGKSSGDPDYKDSANRLSDLLIKLKRDNALREKAKKKGKIGANTDLTSSSMPTAILGLFCPTFAKLQKILKS